jgi:hypothetical protein
VTEAVSDGLLSSDFADAILSRCKKLVMAATVMTAAIVGFSLDRRLIEQHYLSYDSRREDSVSRIR